MRPTDLVQECLARAVGRLDSWQPDGSMRAWLFTILHNLHVNQLRDRGREGALQSSAGDIERHPVPPAQDASLALRDLSAALAQLPDEQRSVILLVGLEGLSYADAATVTGARRLVPSCPGWRAAANGFGASWTMKPRQARGG